MPTNTAPRQTRPGIHVAAAELPNHDTSLGPVSRLIFWTQVLIVVFVLAGVVIAATKL